MEGNHSIRAFSIQLAQDLSQYFGGSFNNFSKILQLSYNFISRYLFIGFIVFYGP
jgi:hypothetical protein